MIEHVFDDRAWEASEGPSAVERALHNWLDRHGTVFTLSDDYRAHGRDHVCGIEVPDHFARLLETGAAHLAAAKAAFVEQGRQAAVQARELAAFAAHRPADVLDRPDDEVGAAAAASRAARPPGLTDVSEWAVDEVMATLSLPSRAASQLLSESIRLVEQLPASLAALEAGPSRGPTRACWWTSSANCRTSSVARSKLRCWRRRPARRQRSSAKRPAVPSSAPTRRRRRSAWRERSATGRCGCTATRTGWRR